MKAIVIERFGEPDVMSWTDVKKPVAKADEIVVKVRAVSVNRSFDLLVRAGKYKRDRIELPLILGADPSGTVDNIGEAVTGFKVGDRVSVTSSITCGVCANCRAGADAICGAQSTIGVHRNGGYAEYVAVPARNAHLIPDVVDFSDATFITRHAGTAFRQLQDVAKIKPDDWVLVMGAAGALGSCGVQTAKYLGARVIAAAGADTRVDIALSLGADFGINYRTTHLLEEVMAITSGEGVHVVMENISDPTLWPMALASLRHGGRLVTGGAHGGGKVELDIEVLYKRQLSIIGAVGASRINVKAALKASAEGQIKALISRIMPLSDAVDAHRYVESGAALGKVILDPCLPPL